MRWTPVATAAFLTLSMMVLTGVAAADAGAGACVLGYGFSATTPAAGSPFVGVNVGLKNSTSGAHTEQGAYEAQCCAEADQAPDCFRPAA
ncbi:MAG TPA: hypothetical protein VFH78_04230 [Candidatus Thermoplasmatota archaeon]|nr:hypothetical protein [Candidatus Thermoplasmatota archaeon]